MKQRKTDRSENKAARLAEPTSDASPRASPPQVKISQIVIGFLAGVACVFVLNLLGFIPDVIDIGGFVFKQRDSEPGSGKMTNPAPPLPHNISLRMDFEQGIQGAATLDVCNVIPPDEYLDCEPAISQLFHAPQSFTGQQSLGCKVDIGTAHEKVYSINFPIDPPLFADGIAANIYISDPAYFHKVTLLARVKGSMDDWYWTWYPVEKPGWMRLFIDLQQIRTANNLPAEQQGIEEIDIDFFTKKVGQGSFSVEVLVDDIEIYYPLPPLFYYSDNP